MNEPITRSLPACSVCGREGELKRGWTMALYCSEKCERRAVCRLHERMPGAGRLSYAGWLPSHIATDITARWAGVMQRRRV